MKVGKEYVVVTPYGYEEEMSRNDLWQWFLYNQPDGIAWFDFVDDIDIKGELKLTNGFLIRQLNRKEVNIKIDSCSHSKKYVNVVSSTLKFWVCPDCKKDLGDAK